MSRVEILQKMQLVIQEHDTIDHMVKVADLLDYLSGELIKE